MNRSPDSGPLDPDYLHWDELRHRKPPDALPHEAWWAIIKLQRSTIQRSLALRDVTGGAFRYSMPDAALESLQIIDSQLSGQIALSEHVTGSAERDRYIVSSLMEEAITSSQLEGAATTNRVAKEMLRSGRPPRTRDERMILNNFEAMRHVQQIRDKRLSRDSVIQLQRILTTDAIDDPGAVGRLRTAEDDIKVRDLETGDIVHVPPDAGQIDERLDSLLAFANADLPKDTYVHPVVRAVLLHFWLAYDHPFVDGNGRTARTLFYWSMLHSRYWLCEYISLSKVLRKAPAAYARAFLHTETDDNDATYFLLHQLRAIRAATDDLMRFIQRKQREVRDTEALLRRDVALNHRQLALLAHALRHADATYTIRSHGTSHAVAVATARADLLDLAEKGVLEQRHVGKTFIFRPVPRLPERVERLRAGKPRPGRSKRKALP